MENLPHLVVNEPNKTNKKKLFGVVVISLMLVFLPLAVFLVRQQTQTRSEAGLELRKPENSFYFKAENSLTNLVEADIFIRSDLENVNLAEAKVSFDPTFLEVVSISTSSANLIKKGQPFASKWIEASFDNTLGTVSLIGGSPNPGVKTDPKEDKELILATILFRPKTTASTVLSFNQASMLYSEKGNANVLQAFPEKSLDTTNSLSLSASPQPSPSSSSVPALEITSPVLGNSYYYFSPLEIIWNSKDINRILAINLYLNGDLLGPIAQNIVNTGRFSWQPDQTVTIPYLQTGSYFQIEVVGRDKLSQELKKLSGQFGITTEQSQVTEGGEFNISSEFTIRDISKQLSNYQQKTLDDPSLDLNKDEVINDLDLYLLRESLLRNSIIK